MMALVMGAIAAANAQPNNTNTKGLPNDLHLVLASELPGAATWCGLRPWQGPPAPFNWCAGRTDVSYYMSPSAGADKVFIDDPSMDALLLRWASPPDDSGPPFPLWATAPRRWPRGPDGPAPDPPAGAIWLGIFLDQTNLGTADIVLYGATNTSLLYQLQSKAVLGFLPFGGWVPGEVKPGVSGTNALWFSPVPCANPPNNCPPGNFFRAVSGANEAFIVADCHPPLVPPQLSCTAIRPYDAQGDARVPQTFEIGLNRASPTNVAVYYSMGGTATNGLDYETLPGYVLIPPNSLSTVTVTVLPIYRTNVGFDPLAVFTLLYTNSCLVNPTNWAVTVPIMDNFSTNPFSIVAAPSQVVDIDYLPPPANCLLLSLNYPTGWPENFALLASNGGLTAWSGVPSLQGEVNMATVKFSTNGFTNGDTYFIAEGTGVIGWVSADGTRFNANWLTLPGEADADETSDLYVDQTGTWSNALLAVTSRPGQWQSDVWLIDSAKSATVVASNLPTPRAEGLLTVPGDPGKYGPLAGQLIVGDEITNRIYVIGRAGTNWVGMVQAWDLGVPGLGVAGQTFLIVPTNQENLYVQDTYSPGQSYVRKLSGSFFASHPGDILALQCYEVQYPNGYLWPPTVWLLRWNGTGYDTWCLILPDLESPPFNFSPGFNIVEKGIFAPFDMRPSQ